MLRGVLSLAAIVAMSTGVAHASNDSFFAVRSEAGAQPVGELSAEWNRVKVSGFDGDLILDGDHGRVRVLAPGAAEIQPGTHTIPAYVIHEGIGCLDQRATIEITHLKRGDTGAIREFDGSVQHRCDRSPDKLFSAEVHYIWPPA